MTIRDEQFSEAIAERDEFLSLLEHPGWVRFKDALESHVKQRDRALDEPLATMDEVLTQEYTKGARQSFRYSLALPQQLIDTAKDAIEAITKEREENENGEDSNSAGDGDNDTNDGDEDS